MRIVFCIYNFIETKLPLQPWLTIQKLAEGLSSREHEIHIVTDIAEPALLDGIQLHSVKSLRGSNKEEILVLLEKLNPDSLVYLPTPLSIATASWLDSIACRKVGFASYSYYTAKELFTALKLLGFKEAGQYLRHLLVPAYLWLRALVKRQSVLIAQSETTAKRLGRILNGKIAAVYIPPGIDLQNWPWSQPATHKHGEISLLYLGSAIAIRGFEVALDAMALVSVPSVRLRVLARGADSDDLAAIYAAVDERGIRNRVEIEGGWIERDKLVEEIHLADAVLQPFVLVPSELPVTAMEVIACGTPVIGSAIDGLPSTIGPAGAVVPQGDAAKLASAIDEFSRNQQLRSAWSLGCQTQRDHMLAWDTVIDKWEEVLGG